MSKLLAIDGMSILRPIFEVNPEPDLKKRAREALDNAVSSFGRLLGTHRPSHVLPAFDAEGNNWRHDLYPAYQAERAPMAQELRDVIPEFLDRLRVMGLCPVCIDGVEADDVIGTGVMHWLGKGYGDAIVATSDKDLHQLIEFGALVWDHFKREMHDEEWVKAKFGVPPSQLGDLLALWGDATDGVPGVEGIGKKGAAKLLQKYGSIDAIMKGAGILLDTTGRALRRDKDKLYLSRQLVSLKTDVTVGVTWKMLAFRLDD